MLEDFGITGDDKKTNLKESRKMKRAREIAHLDTLGDDRPIEEIVKDKEKKMKEAAQKLEFELAAVLRDELRELRARSRAEK